MGLLNLRRRWKEGSIERFMVVSTVTFRGLMPSQWKDLIGVREMNAKFSRLKGLIVALSCGAMPLITEIACDPNGYGGYFFRDDDGDYYYDDYYYDDYYYYDPWCDPYYCY